MRCSFSNLGTPLTLNFSKKCSKTSSGVQGDFSQNFISFFIFLLLIFEAYCIKIIFGVSLYCKDQLNFLLPQSSDPKTGNILFSCRLNFTSFFRVKLWILFQVVPWVLNSGFKICIYNQFSYLSTCLTSQFFQDWGPSLDPFKGCQGLELTILNPAHCTSFLPSTTPPDS